VGLLDFQEGFFSVKLDDYRLERLRNDTLLFFYTCQLSLAYQNLELLIIYIFCMQR